MERRVRQPLSTIASGMVQWNHRFTAYAAAHGKTPTEMVAADDAAYPGGRMAGYINWIRSAWDEWERVTGRPSRDQVPLSAAEHQAFDEWLGARAARDARELADHADGGDVLADRAAVVGAAQAVR